MLHTRRSAEAEAQPRPRSSRRTSRLTSALAFLVASCGAAPKQPPAVDGAVAATPATATPAAAAPAPAPIDASGFRTAIDLHANRVHAGLQRDGRLVVDAGGIDFLKYIDGGWKTSWLLGTKDEGHPAALVAGLSAMAFLPVDPDGTLGGSQSPRDGLARGNPALPHANGDAKPADATLSITMRALAPQQRVSLFVNEKPLSTLEVDKASKRYDVTVPAALLHPGDNRVRLTFKGAADVAGGKRAAAAVTSLAFGPAALGPPTDTGGPLAAREVDLGGARRRALVPGGAGSRISYYLQLPEGAHLAFGYGAATPGGSVLAQIAVDGKPARTVHEGNVGATWSDALVDLGAAGGQAARIDLIARGTKGDLAWGEPRVVVKSPAPAAAPSPQPKFDHIFVWMVDTLRADKLRPYNAKTRVTTPNYDAFAADATRFAWAQVPGTWSLPSHASLLTGVYPTVHRATAHEARLSKDVPFIAEDMKKAGFKTGMFSSNGYISSKWGFDRGWDVNRNFIRESLANGSEFLWKTAKAWLTPIVAKRQFAYLATIEPHVAYAPRKEFLVKYWDKAYIGPIKPALSGVQLGLIKGGKLKVTDNDKQYLEALHDAEISQSDAAFATFIADIKKLGIYEKSAVIVVSDHGDQFYEHGSVGHGDTVYQELVHVPLIIRAPGVFPAGRVVHADVEVMDVYATLLELAGLPPTAAAAGASLVPLARDEVGGSPRAALTVDGQVSRGLKVQRYRMVHRGPGRIELYDEYDDPREQKDLAADKPIALRGMRGVLGLLYAYENTWSKTTWGTAANVNEAFYTAAGAPGRRGADPKSGGPK